MKTTKVQAEFAALLDAFEPISGQPTDKDLTRLRQVALSALVPISYDREKGKHLSLGLLLNDDKYCARHGDVEFPSDAAKRLVIYGKISKLMLQQACGPKLKQFTTQSLKIGSSLIARSVRCAILSFTVWMTRGPVIDLNAG